jgi:hypothetical protein
VHLPGHAGQSERLGMMGLDPALQAADGGVVLPRRRQGRQPRHVAALRSPRFVHHQHVGHLARQRVAAGQAQQVQAQVHAGVAAAGAGHLAVVREHLVDRQPGFRIAAAEVLLQRPVRGGAPAVQHAGLAEHVGRGADAGEARQHRGLGAARPSRAQPVDPWRLRPQRGLGRPPDGGPQHAVGAFGRVQPTVRGQSAQRRLDRPAVGAQAQQLQQRAAGHRLAQAEHVQRHGDAGGHRVGGQREGEGEHGGSRGRVGREAQ